MRIAPAATELEVQAFERRYRVRIEPEFRAYLLTANGMLQSANDQCDSNLFAFWQVDRIRPVAEECPELQTTPQEKQYFVFADYMIWSWAYAIDLNSNSATSGTVVLVGGLKEQRVASSFLEFALVHSGLATNIREPSLSLHFAPRPVSSLGSSNPRWVDLISE